MDDLIRWLRAQLDHMEQWALTLSDPPRFANMPEPWSLRDYLLADVDAKRRIIDAYIEAKPFYDARPSVSAGELEGLYTAIRLLALPYADREGYREEWRP